MRAESFEIGWGGHLLARYVLDINADPRTERSHELLCLEYDFIMIHPLVTGSSYPCYPLPLAKYDRSLSFNIQYQVCGLGISS